MKLKVGMYVRTKYGIRKIIKIDEDNNYYIDKTYTNDFRQEINCISDSCIIGKPSFDIIDLIEIGDILEVSSDLHDLLGNDIFRVRDENHLKHLKNGFDKGYFHLISIITKEQFEQMEYKVGE